MRGSGRAITVGLALALVGATASSAGADARAALVHGPTRTFTVDKADTHEVAKLTGPGSINHTDEKWQVGGTDLGSMFMLDGKLVMTFGDTFAKPFTDDWRSNVMAFSSDTDPADGITFDSMVTDRPGHAKELIDQSAVPGEEVTVIPTYGTAVDGRMYLHYMAVREWQEPGHWALNQSGLAYSDDNGQTWKVSDVVWPGDSNFGQVAMVPRGDDIYLYGIPGGRFGGVRLAKVAKDKLLDASAYRYWDGTTWGTSPANAKTIVPAPVGELSVQYNSYYRTWLMTYLNDETDAVVLRTAPELTGPWSDEQPVVTAQEAPALYAPFMPPRWNNGPDIYFALSQFGPYNVFWWHTSLKVAKS
jgi:hypothetical protein